AELRGEAPPGRGGSTAELRPTARKSRSALFVGVVAGVAAVAAAVSFGLLRRERPAPVAPVDPDMVVIAGGQYRIGSDRGPLNARPEHTEAVKPFGLDIREVSVGEYRSEE